MAETDLQFLIEATRQLEALIQADKGESDEAEALRDKMDGPYYRLTADEMERLKCSLT